MIPVLASGAVMPVVAGVSWAQEDPGGGGRINGAHLGIVAWAIIRLIGLKNFPDRLSEVLY